MKEMDWAGVSTKEPSIVASSENDRREMCKYAVASLCQFSDIGSFTTAFEATKNQYVALMMMANAQMVRLRSIIDRNSYFVSEKIRDTLLGIRYEYSNISLDGVSAITSGAQVETPLSVTQQNATQIEDKMKELLRYFETTYGVTYDESDLYTKHASSAVERAINPHLNDPKCIQYLSMKNVAFHYATLLRKNTNQNEFWNRQIESMLSTELNRFSLRLEEEKETLIELRDQIVDTMNLLCGILIAIYIFSAVCYANANKVNAFLSRMTQAGMLSLIGKYITVNGESGRNLAGSITTKVTEVQRPMLRNEERQQEQEWREPYAHEDVLSAFIRKNYKNR